MYKWTSEFDIKGRKWLIKLHEFFFHTVKLKPFNSVIGNSCLNWCPLLRSSIEHMSRSEEGVGDRQEAPASWYSLLPGSVSGTWPMLLPKSMQWRWWEAWDHLMNSWHLPCWVALPFAGWRRKLPYCEHHMERATWSGAEGSFWSTGNWGPPCFNHKEMETTDACVRSRADPSPVTPADEMPALAKALTAALQRTQLSCAHGNGEMMHAVGCGSH